MMMGKRFFYVLIMVIMAGAPLNVQGQGQETVGAGANTGSLRNKALNVFLDCHRCDKDYMRRTIPYVNYVLNKDEADVHILISNRRTGSGGREYNIRYIGRDEFENIEYELDFFSSPDDSDDQVREGLTNMLALGLMQFVAKTPLAENIELSYQDEEQEEGTQASDHEVDDPWNNWVFRIRADGKFNKEESYENPEYSMRLSADRITPEWKLEFDSEYENRVTIYNLDNGTYRYEKSSYSVRQSVIKSLGDHWSAGGRFSLSGSSYNNIEFGYSIDPGIEYNFFPYHESSKRQIRMQYHMKFMHNNYQDTTIFNKITENLWQQEASFSVGFRQAWGNANFTVRWQNYMHDFEKYSLSVWSGFNIRIYKGLSVNFSIRGALQRDQISLLKENATEEEVLLRQRALASDYNYNFRMGISYTFGSIYNNVVNPRFGH